jgi:phosphatidylserine/phosphatidylglycerophosphate/cardiolipin synthase-like enzyme
MPREQIDAIQDRIKIGVDVRLITSQYETQDLVEKLKDAGLDTSVLRIQPHVHNKGIVVDSVAAMISSQNRSADGTLYNRDAGVIIWNAEAAAYFEEIFLHDWNNLSTANIPPAPKKKSSRNRATTSATKTAKTKSDRAKSARAEKGVTEKNLLTKLVRKPNK